MTTNAHLIKFHTLGNAKTGRAWTFIVKDFVTTGASFHLDSGCLRRQMLVDWGVDELHGQGSEEVKY